MLNNTKLRFIYEGKQYIIPIMLKETIYKKINVYYSDSIENIKVLKLGTGEVLVILNRQYENTKSKDEINIEIWYNILAVNNLINKEAIDIFIATWYGYSGTIKFINNLHNISDDNKLKRTKLLEKIMMSNKQYGVPRQDYFVEHMIGE